jgi:Mor family transcriptional regulator
VVVIKQMMIQVNDIVGGLKGLEQSIGQEYSEQICRAFPSENLYIYKVLEKNRRLIDILPMEIVAKIVSVFGGGVICLPQGAKFLKQERNMAILKDRQPVEKEGEIVKGLTIPSLIAKYKMSRTAIHTILRAEIAKEKSQYN